MILIFFVLLILPNSSIKSMPIPQPADLSVGLPGTIPASAPLPNALAPIAQPAAPNIVVPQPFAATPAPAVQTTTPAPVALAPTVYSTAAPTPLPIPTPLPAPAPTPFPSTTSTTADSYKQELTKITADIDSVNTLKGTLKAQLTDLDSKLAQVQEQLSGIKKLSFDILSKEDEVQASKAVETMKQSLTSVQNMQKTIETSTVQEFNATAQKIRNLMTSVQTQLQALESKSTALKTASPTAPAISSVTPPPAPAMLGTPTTPFGIAPIKPQIQTPALAPTPAPIAKIEEKLEQRSLIHKFFNTVADVVTGSITMIASILSSVKEMIIPQQPTLNQLEQKKELEDAKKKVAPISPTTPTLLVPKAPLGSPSFESQVKSNIATIEQVVKKLDDQRLSIKQMVGDIKKQSKSLRQRIAQNPDFKKDASSKLSFDEERSADAWKKKAQSWFEILLNGIDTTVTTITHGITALYNAGMQGVTKGWNAINKATEQEQQKQSAAQTNSPSTSK